MNSLHPQQPFRAEFRRHMKIAAIIIITGLLVSLLATFASAQGGYTPVYLYAVRAQDAAEFDRQSATVAKWASIGAATQASAARVRRVASGGETISGDSQFTQYLLFSAGADVRLTEANTAFDGATRDLNQSRWLDAYALFRWASEQYLEARAMYVTAAEFALAAKGSYGG